MQELQQTRTVLALVNGEPWDMHRPLDEDCEIKFLHFEDEDPRLANNVRSFVVLGCM
jgi:large subunit ribosomal protein L39